LNKDSLPGHYTKKIFSNTKESCFQPNIIIAKHLLDTAKQRPIRNWTLWEMLGKQKTMKLTYDISTDASCRLIWNPEYAFGMIATTFANKMADCINYSEVEKRFKLNKKFDLDKSYGLFEKRIKFDFFIDADWKQFDSTISKTILKIATAIKLSEFASKSKENKRVSYYLMSSVITKYLILNPGIVLCVEKGNASGHPFVTLTNCYANMIYWCLIAYQIYGENYADNIDFDIYGDDAQVFFKYHENIYKIDEYISNLGLKSEPMAENFFPTKLFNDWESQPDFLKRKTDLITLTWNYSKMFDRLIYVEKDRTINEQISHLNDYLNQTPNDDLLAKFIEEIVLFAQVKHFNYNFDKKLLRNVKNTISNANNFSAKHYQIGNHVIDDNGWKKDKERFTSSFVYIKSEKLVSEDILCNDEYNLNDIKVATFITLPRKVHNFDEIRLLEDTFSFFKKSIQFGAFNYFSIMPNVNNFVRIMFRHKNCMHYLL